MIQGDFVAGAAASKGNVGGLTGKLSLPEGVWFGGLFDKDSWQEVWREWGKTVVTGRARLGGVPVGVIAVEVRSTRVYVPADPGQPDSSERESMQAG